jgi:hypothetical protein
VPSTALAVQNAQVSPVGQVLADLFVADPSVIVQGTPRFVPVP